MVYAKSVCLILNQYYVKMVKSLKEIVARKKSQYANRKKKRHTRESKRPSQHTHWYILHICNLYGFSWFTVFVCNRAVWTMRGPSFDFLFINFTNWCIYHFMVQFSIIWLVPFAKAYWMFSCLCDRPTAQHLRSMKRGGALPVSLVPPTIIISFIRLFLYFRPACKCVRLMHCVRRRSQTEDGNVNEIERPSDLYALELLNWTAYGVRVFMIYSCPVSYRRAQ